MPRSEEWTGFWRFADIPEAAIGADELDRWPKAGAVLLQELGVLVDAGLTRQVACDACGVDHVETVHWINRPGRGADGYISCPEAGRVPVAKHRLRQWKVDPRRIAALTSLGFGLQVAPTELVPSRLWVLGPVRAGRKDWNAFLGRGLGEKDGPGILEREQVKRARYPLLIVPSLAGERTLKVAGRAAVLALAEIVRLDSKGFSIGRIDDGLIHRPAGRPHGSNSLFRERPPKTVLLAQLNEAGNPTQVWKRHYEPKVSRSTVYDWCREYRLEWDEAAERRRDKRARIDPRKHPFRLSSDAETDKSEAGDR